MFKIINLFAGYDRRESMGFHVFTQSVIDHATALFGILPLSNQGLTQGSNAFTLSRFLIPWLMNFQDHAIFADASDMLMLGDVGELDGLFDPQFAVQVVKHPTYQTKHKTKYRGTDMECPNMDYPRKNWTSLMLMNCAHPSWANFTPEKILNTPPLDLLQLSNCMNQEIGALPDCWNRLADEGHPIEGAKLLHWTAGFPGFENYKDSPAAAHWHATRAGMDVIG